MNNNKFNKNNLIVDTTVSVKLQNTEIKLIIDSLHREATRCDDVVEDMLIRGNMKNINYHTNKAASLRELAHSLLNNHQSYGQIIEVKQKEKFDPNKVLVLTPGN